MCHYYCIKIIIAVLCYNIISRTWCYLKNNGLSLIYFDKSTNSMIIFFANFGNYFRVQCDGACTGKTTFRPKSFCPIPVCPKYFVSNMNMANYIMSYIMFGQILFVQNILVLGQPGPILFLSKKCLSKSFSTLTLCSRASFVQMIFVPLFLVHISFSPM